jgi:hypothetical protein
MLYEDLGVKRRLRGFNTKNRLVNTGLLSSCAIHVSGG